MKNSEAIVRTAMIGFLALISLAAGVNGQVPNTISYQGFLLEIDGKAVPDDTYNLNFRIYNTATEGSSIWEEDQYSVLVQDGRFSVILGDYTDLSTVPFDEPYWLGISVNGGPELEPRIEFTSSAYSLNARSIEDNAVTSLKIQDGAVTSSKIEDNAVTSSKIEDGAVGPDDLAVDAVDSTKIAAGGISFSDLGQNGATEWQVMKWNGSEWMAADDDTGPASTPIECSDCDDSFLNADGDVVIGLLTFNNPGGPTNISFKVDEATRGWVKADPDIDRIEFHADGYYYFTSDVTDAIEGRTTAADCSGVTGTTEAEGAAGVSGHNDGVSTSGMGVAGWSGAGMGVYGWSETGWAGYFDGNVYIDGTLTGGKGTAVIDHPLDPRNKFLAHSFIGSPDMKNVYDGVAELDANGQAIVELPGYFEALNKDFRYQLTCIGGYAPVYIAQEIHDNRFTIDGGLPGMRVCWQVTGIRRDALAQADPLDVEVQKTASGRGKYLHPAAHGFSEEYGLDYEKRDLQRVRSKRK